MRTPKRLHFYPTRARIAREKLAAQGVIELLNAVKQVTTAVGGAIRSLQAKIHDFATADYSELRKELEWQALKMHSWERNDLADTLTQAGISHDI